MHACICVVFVVFIVGCGQDKFKDTFKKEKGGNFPSPGNSGIISASYNDPSILDIRWQSASDDITSPDRLQYRIFASASVFASYAEGEASADELTAGWTLGISSLQVRVVSGAVYNWCNVFVRDDDGNISAYKGSIP
ncbi:MAG TPA: hypothetical protein VF857_02255, partial [Spirochaetota bacterium]